MAALPTSQGPSVPGRVEPQDSLLNAQFPHHQLSIIAATSHQVLLTLLGQAQYVLIVDLGPVFGHCSIYLRGVPIGLGKEENGDLFLGGGGGGVGGGWVGWVGMPLVPV